MTKPVTLSERAFAALRREKKSTESDSDTVLRLIANQSKRRKDPVAHFHHKVKPDVDLDVLEQWLAGADEAGRKQKDPWSRRARP